VASNISNTPNANTAAAAATTLRGRVSYEQDSPVESNRFDPSLLARIAAEEELKKRGGGGGGGSAPSFNPNVWVSYSFVEIAKAIEELRQAFNQALAAATEAPAGFVAQASESVTAAVKNFSSQFQLPNFNLATSLQNMMSKGINNTLAAVDRAVANLINSGHTMMSAIANGLKKVFYGKDESIKDIDEEIYEKEGGILDGLVEFFGIKDQDKETNGKNIKAHIDNQSNQLTKWAASMTDSIERFWERWLKL